MADVAQDIPIAAQAPPPRSTGALGWLKANLFNGIANTILTLLCVALLAVAIPPVIRWGLIDAIWQAPNGAACHGGGACWAFIGEKFRFILFGFFPVAETWRPVVVVIVFLAMIVAACDRRMWGRRLGILWLVGLLAVFALMRGGFAGMGKVETAMWSGLPLTLILAVVGMLVGFPLGVLLALGRRSKLPAVRTICIGYIELIRGVPLITLLFMASLMLPLFLPEGVTVDKLIRAQVAFIMFAGAYLAEVVRGGLQAIPRGQIEAAEALGLSYVQRTRLIVLPQALSLVIPPLVNTFIGIFKDTALVIIISLFDLLTTAETALGDANWQGFYVEAYVFVGIIYWSFCFFMSRYSQLLEREFNRGRRR
jgi:general L-amino acid transport system permease protein